MAGIDKIYATQKGAQAIVAFLQKNREAIKSKTHLDPMNFVYDLSWDDWDQESPGYAPRAKHPVTNFPLSIDVCLWQMDKLPKALENGLKSQYSEESLERFKKGEGLYSFRRWDPPVATNFRFDWRGCDPEFRKCEKRLPLPKKKSRKFVSVYAYYFGPGNEDACGTTLWFTDEARNDGRMWQCDVMDLNDNVYGTCNGASVRVKSMKAFLRWLQKCRFPKGTVLSCNYGWKDSDFKVYCE